MSPVVYRLMPPNGVNGSLSLRTAFSKPSISELLSFPASSIPIRLTGDQVSCFSLSLLPAPMFQYKLAPQAFQVVLQRICTASVPVVHVNTTQSNMLQERAKSLTHFEMWDLPIPACPTTCKRTVRVVSRGLSVGNRLKSKSGRSEYMASFSPFISKSRSSYRGNFFRQSAFISGFKCSRDATPRRIPQARTTKQ